jgi:hypothetical protein
VFQVEVVFMGCRSEEPFVGKEVDRASEKGASMAAIDRRKVSGVGLGGE